MAPRLSSRLSPRTIEVDEDGSSSSDLPVIPDYYPPQTASSSSSMQKLNKYVSAGGPSKARGAVSCSSNRTKKSFRFNRTVAIHKVLPLRLYTDFEIADCWYSCEEFDMMREQLEHDADCLETHEGMMKMIQKEEGDSSFCRRGLERHTREGSLERRKNKDAGLDAVFDEQIMQDETGVQDPDYLAHLYKIAASSAQGKAHAIGLMDELEAFLLR